MLPSIRPLQFKTVGCIFFFLVTRGLNFVPEKIDLLFNTKKNVSCFTFYVCRTKYWFFAKPIHSVPRIRPLQYIVLFLYILVEIGRKGFLGT